MTLAYYLMGFFLLALSLIYQSPKAGLIGLYYWTNTDLTAELKPYPTTWYLFFIILHVAYAGYLWFYGGDPTLKAAGLFFLGGAILTVLTYMGYDAGHRLYGYFDMALNGGIVFCTLLYLYRQGLPF